MNSTYLALVILFGLAIGFLCWSTKCPESFHQTSFTSSNTTPPFPYPADLQQPAGAKGWGYRDPQATYQTLLWEQNQPAILLPNYNQTPSLGFFDMSVPSAPVPIKTNPFANTCNRPPVQNVQQRPQATSNYTNWASTLQA